MTNTRNGTGIIMSTLYSKEELMASSIDDLLEERDNLITEMIIMKSLVTGALFALDSAEMRIDGVMLTDSDESARIRAASAILEHVDAV